MDEPVRTPKTARAVAIQFFLNLACVDDRDRNTSMFGANRATSASDQRTPGIRLFRARLSKLIRTCRSAQPKLAGLAWAREQFKIHCGQFRLRASVGNIATNVCAACSCDSIKLDSIKLDSIAM